MRLYKLILILLLAGTTGYAQNSRLTIVADGEETSYNLKKCYKSGKLIRTPKGRRFKIVVWGSYAPWSKEYSLIIRSLDGKYSTNRQIKNLTENIEINFKQSL